MSNHDHKPEDFLTEDKVTSGVESVDFTVPDGPTPAPAPQNAVAAKSAQLASESANEPDPVSPLAAKQAAMKAKHKPTSASPAKRKNCEVCGTELRWSKVTHKTPTRFCSNECRNSPKLKDTTLPPDRKVLSLSERAKGNKGGGGSPEVPFTDREWEILKVAAAAKLPVAWVGRYLGVSRQVITSKLRKQISPEHPDGFTWETFTAEYQGEAVTSLVVKAFESAMSDSAKSVSDRIFLLKNWAGYSDSTKVTRVDGGKADVSQMSPKERDEALSKLLEKTKPSVSDNNEGKDTIQ